MALEFRFSLASEFKDNQLVELILKNFDFETKVPSEKYGDFVGEGFVCWLYELDETKKEIVSEEHGINTNICLYFWHNNDKYEVGLLNIINIVYFVLKKTTGDAVFESVSGDTKLIRINQNLSFNTSSFSDDDEAIWQLKDIPFINFQLKDLS